MDAKITKTRIAHMLSYDWLKIVGVALALMLFWNFIFTITATLPRPSQQFTVFNHYANQALSEDFYNDLYDNVNGTINDAFSYEVIEITTNDLVTLGQYASAMTEARLQLDEGDVMFIPKLSDPSTAYEENGETKYEADYLQSFLRRYHAYLYDLDPEKEGGYFYELKAYLNGYYEDYQNAETIDKAKIEKDFRARAKKNEDKRFKTEAQLAWGAKKEVERIEKYRAALLKFESFLESGLVAFEEVEAESGKYQYKGKFALNICPNEDTMGALKKYASYGETVVDENGKEKFNTTAKDMCVMFFDTKGTEDGFEYESLLYVVHLIEACAAV